MATGMDYSLVQRIIDGLGKILDTKPGSPDEGTYVTEQQFADWIKGQTFVTGYYYNSAFYSDLAHTNLITPQANVLYADLGAYGLYAWDGAAYQPFTPDLSPYATKAEMQTADTNLNNALTALDHRVENLEQSKGDYVVNTYKDGSTTPSGKGNWAVVEGLRGVSRVENNLSEASATHYINDVHVVKNSDGSVTLDGTASAGGSLGSHNDVSIIVGHCYLLNMVGDTSKAQIYTDINGNKAVTSAVITANSGSAVSLRASSGTVFSNNVYWVVTTDLNIYFGTTDLSFLGATDSAKLATIQTNYPHLLLPTEYGTRIVDAGYVGVRAWSRNIFDEQTESGKYDASGSKEIDHNRIRCVNLLPVTANTTYYIKIGNYAGNYCAVFEYDADGNFIQMITPNASTHLFTTSGNCRYITFFLSDLYGTSYKNDVCISVSDSLNGTYTPYHAPNTLSLSYTGKSAGSVAEMYYPETGEQTHPIGTIDMGTMDWILDSGVFYARLDAMIEGAVCLQSIYGNLGVQTWAYMTGTAGDKSFASAPSGSAYPYVMIKDSSFANASSLKTYLTGKTMYYPLATPAPSTFVTPIIDNTLLTESGGRMATVQTGTVVDGSFDLGFITL